jgi:uncharacterized membrane protein
MVTLFVATAIVAAAAALFAALAFAALAVRIGADFMTHDAVIYWWVCVRVVCGRVFLTSARVSLASGLSGLSIPRKTMRFVDGK